MPYPSSAHAWIDSRELLPGGLLGPAVAKEIDEGAAYAVVVSPASLQSRWVGKELLHALEVREEFDRARAARKPYHVIHFDGHGVYDCSVGLGGLCFENPQDIGKLDQRRHVHYHDRRTGTPPA